MKIRKNFFLILIFMILISTTASAKEITVDDDSVADFRSIQEAVNNSSPGDVISVYPGIYNKSVDITVENVSILSKSEDPKDTVVQGFNLKTTDIIINGFYIKNSSIIIEGELGRNIISNNIIVNGDISVRAFSDGNVFLNNTVLNGYIDLGDSGGHKVLGNYIYRGYESLLTGPGIYLHESSYNQIENNTIVNCNEGIVISLLSEGNKVDNNILTSNNQGISADRSARENSFLNNNISNNNIGIFIGCPCSLMNNKIENNKECGIYFEMQYPYDNGIPAHILIYNNIFNNSINVKYETEAEEEDVTWNITKTTRTNILEGPYSGGNFWAKPDGTGFSQISEDLDRDGIGDQPYKINEDQFDYLPLASLSSLQSLVLPTANFTANIIKRTAPFSVQFTDSSDNATRWHWDFGDGTNSTEQNPLHNYSAAGNYIANLTVSDANGTDSKLYTINLQTSVYAYITNYGSNNVSVIDTVTNTVIATVYVGFNPLGVTVNPSGTKVYVTNEDGTVSVIDTSTNTVTDSVPVGHLPYGIAINPAGTRVYVVNLGDNTVSVIDTATNTVAATVSVGDNPIGIAVSPDGTKVYVTNHDSNSVSVIDAATNTVTDMVNVGQWPIGVAVNPSGKKVYVANVYSNSVSVIDTATNTVTATVKVGEGPVAVAISPDGKKAYVTNSGPISILGTVSVIDTATNNVTTKVSVGNSPYGVAVTPDGTKIYAANEDGTVSVIDIATNNVSDIVPVGQWPIAFGQFLASVPTKSVLPITNLSTNVKRIITVADNGKSIGLKSGEIFYLILDDNPSTGFSWELNLSNGLAILNDISIPNSLPLLMQEHLSGWGYSDIRAIKADRVGTQQIKGVYKQHWNGGMEIPYCVNLTVDNSYPDKTICCYRGRSTGGGGSASSEPSTNVKMKEISQAFIKSGSSVKFDFPKNDTSVMYVCFDSKKTGGKKTTIVEMLKGKSVFVSELPSDEVYKYLNIWVGNNGFATSKNIENAVVSFKVDNSWIQNKNIDKSSITLNRYSDKKWNPLPTNLSGEDDKYLYLTAKTQGFSPFAITGKTITTGTAVQPASGNKTQSNMDDIQNKIGNTISSVEQISEQKNNTSSSEKESTKASGFEIASVIICLLSIFLYKRK